MNMIKMLSQSRYIYLFLIFYSCSTSAASAQEAKLVIYPGEGYQTVLAETTNGLTLPLGWVRGPSEELFEQLSKSSWDKEDVQNAYTFRTEIVQEGNVPSLSSKDFVGPFNIVHFWRIDSLYTAYSTRGKNLYKTDLRKVVRNLTNGLFIEADIRPKTIINGDWLQDIIPCTYRGKICTLLWDEADKMTLYRPTEQEFRTNELESSLRDARYMVLCQYDENCYALLMLTKPIIGLNKAD